MTSADAPANNPRGWPQAVVDELDAWERGYAGRTAQQAVEAMTAPAEQEVAKQ